MSGGSPLGPIRLLPFARPPQASCGTGGSTAKSAEGIYDKRAVLFEAASLIESLLFEKEKNEIKQNHWSPTQKKQRKEQAVSDFYLFVLTASISETLFFPLHPSEWTRGESRQQPALRTSHCEVGITSDMKASRISLFVLQLPPCFRRVAPFHSHAQAICSRSGSKRERGGGRIHSVFVNLLLQKKKKLFSLRFPFVGKARGP